MAKLQVASSEVSALRNYARPHPITCDKIPWLQQPQVTEFVLQPHERVILMWLINLEAEMRKDQPIEAQTFYNSSNMD
jgi:hypothetical protein